MISLKKQYDNAKDKAIELMNKGLLKEYINQLQTVNNIRVALIKYNN